MHNRKAGIAFVGMGAVLLIAALLLFLYNEGSNAVMEEANHDIYEELYRIIEQQTAEREAEEESTEVSVNEPGPELPDAVPLEEPSEEAEEIPAAPAMTIATVDGYDYIGILEIPALELAVPILSDWDEKKLNIAPCRHFGSAETDDLVIAGHNYRRHFLNLYKLTAGDEVQFTTMDGTVIDYTVAEKRTLEATAVDTVLESEYALILYTCTYTGTERTAVFCQRNDGE